MTDRVGHKDIPYTKRRYYSHPGQKIYPNEKKYKGAMNVGRKVGWGSHAFNTGFSDGKKRLVHSNTLYRAGKATRKTPGLNQVYRVGRWASRDPVTAGFVGALGYGAYKAFKNRKRVQYE